MPFDFAALKAQVRQTVHDTLALPGLYLDATLEEPVQIGVRFHYKGRRVGDIYDQGYAEVVEGVDRLIFNKAELIEKGIVPVRGATVTLSAAGYDNIVLALHVREPDDGPTETIWQVSKE